MLWDFLIELLMNEQEINQLITEIYQSVEDVSQLILVMHKIETAIGAAVGTYNFASLTDMAKVSHLNLSTRPYFQAFHHEYALHYHKINPRAAYLISGEIGEWITDHNNIDPAIIEQSRYYNECLKIYGLRHIVACVISRQHDYNEVICFHRKIEDGPFEPAHFELLQQLSAHLVLSAKLRHEFNQLKHHQDSQKVIFSYLSYGAIWVNAQSNILSINEAGAQILAEQDGLVNKNDKLLAVDPADQQQLKLAINPTASNEPRQHWFFINRRKQQARLLLSSMPVHGYPAQTHAAIEPITLLIVYDANRITIPSTQFLKNLFELTPKEASLATALLHNMTLEEYAQQHDISYNTVRTHLAHLMQKTGASRQSELVRLLLTAHPHISSS